MRDDDLELDFPDLRASGYRVTSQASAVPNCIGWALNDKTHYWDPLLTGFMGGYYWPDGLPRDDRVETWRTLFELFGYRQSPGPALEVGVEKIAIYGDASGDAHHVARQLPSGAWTSKLGQDKDIEHQAPDALAGNLYGRVVAFMERPRR
jgi:hypothetical protein